MLAQLEQQRILLDQERADVDAVIETVRRRAGLVVPAGLRLPPALNDGPKRKPAKAAAASNGKSKITPAQIATMRRLFESGASSAEICKAAKVTDATIYRRAKMEGWKRPKAEKPPKGEQLSGSVRCNHCGTMTDYDPCRSCGKKLTRKW